MLCCGDVHSSVGCALALLVVVQGYVWEAWGLLGTLRPPLIAQHATLLAAHRSAGCASLLNAVMRGR